MLVSFLFVFAANLVLHRTVERIHVGKQYGDIPRGIFVIRGENVILLGEVVIFESRFCIIYRFPLYDTALRTCMLYYV